MDKLCMRMYAMWLCAKQDLHDFMEDEHGAVDIVAIVVLIGIAVMLALFFRDQIKGILDQLFKNIKTETSKVTEPL